MAGVVNSAQAKPAVQCPLHSGFGPAFTAGGTDLLSVEFFREFPSGVSLRHQNTDSTLERVPVVPVR